MCDLHITRATIVATAFLVTFSVLGHGIAEAGQTSSTELNCDNDGSGLRDIADAVHYTTWLFLAGPPPATLEVQGIPTELLNGDCNGDGGRDFIDCMSFLFWLFGGGDEPVAPEPPVTTTFAGALAASNGEWSYGGMMGLEGAMAECERNFPGSSVCVPDQLRAAEAAGELSALTDVTGRAVMGFWINDPTADSTRQCPSSTMPGVSYFYKTGHLSCGGIAVTVDQSGKLGQTADVTCGSSFWVPCCNGSDR